MRMNIKIIRGGPMTMVEDLLMKTNDRASVEQNDDGMIEVTWDSVRLTLSPDEFSRFYDSMSRFRKFWLACRRFRRS